MGGTTWRLILHVLQLGLHGLQRCIQLADAGLEFVGQVSLCFDFLGDIGASLIDLRQRFIRLKDLANLNLIEPSGFFFPVAGDERNGSSLSCKL